MLRTDRQDLTHPVYRAPVGGYRDTPALPILRDIIPVLQLSGQERTEINAVLQKSAANVCTIPPLDQTLSLRSLVTLARSFRDNISKVFGNLVIARDDIQRDTNKDPATHSSLLKHFWHPDVPNWFGKVAEISHTAGAHSEAIREYLQTAHTNKVLDLYHPDGSLFKAMITEVDSIHTGSRYKNDLTGMYVQVTPLEADKTTTVPRPYYMSLEQLQRMQQKPVLYGPQTAEATDIEAYIQHVFASNSSAKLQKVALRGNKWHIHLATRENRAYTIVCTVDSKARGGLYEHRLRMDRVKDWQTLLGNQALHVFKGDTLTVSKLSLLIGRTNFIHQDSNVALETKTMSRSMWERAAEFLQRPFQ